MKKIKNRKTLEDALHARTPTCHKCAWAIYWDNKHIVTHFTGTHMPPAYVATHQALVWSSWAPFSFHFFNISVDDISIAGAHVIKRVGSGSKSDQARLCWPEFVGSSQPIWIWSARVPTVKVSRFRLNRSYRTCFGAISPGGSFRSIPVNLVHFDFWVGS